MNLAIKMKAYPFLTKIVAKNIEKDPLAYLDIIKIFEEKKCLEPLVLLLKEKNLTKGLIQKIAQSTIIKGLYL